MTTPDVAALTGRVERLEKQNSRLKRFGMVALICAGSLVVMAQNRTRTIDAESFVLKDAGGKTRARLAVIGDRPELSFLDDANKPYMTLAGGAGSFLTLSQPGDALQRQITLTAGKALFGMAIYGPYSSACSKVGCVSAGLSLVENSPAFSLYDNQGVEVANMQWGKKVGAQLMLGGLESKQQAMLALDSAGTRLTLRDGNGFHSVLGNNELETETTGETRQTSAASLVMFKDNKLIWKAP